MLNEKPRGWKSAYDYPGMSNTDKYMGRMLHVQDNFWGAAKVVLVIFLGVIIWVIVDGQLWDLSWIKSALNYLR